VTLFHEDAVDQPAMVVSQPTPEYPAVLKAAQLEGRVVLEFVVDTMGAVEPHSVTVLESTHPGFGRSAVESVLGSRFTPAKIRGAAVRQVVRQGVSFRIER
jgi:protein TonB